MAFPAAYLPIDRRLAMARGETLPERTVGTALFADISGFTPLTEALTKDLGAKRGAEELTKQLNRVYSALIAALDQFQGSVITFSGDAITCWFDGDAGWRAATCALAMQTAMREFATVITPSGAVLALAIKVALASGPARRFSVGDASIQTLDVLAGAPLNRLAAAEHHANKGEIVASAEIIANLGANVRVSEWRDDDQTGQRFAVVADLLAHAAPTPWPDLAPDALSATQIRPWLLPGMYDLVSSGQDEFLAELRPTVALFARFGGIDYEHDDESRNKLDAYMRWVQRIVTRYEGSLLQLMIGDKGSYFCCAFGAPVAHDDDSMRAVAAALELQALPVTLGSILRSPSGGDSWPMQIGITRGRMRTGPYGSATRRTYSILGDEVNLAARLMTNAEPGQILVSQAIANAVSKQYNVRLIGPLTVKGKAAPTLVSSVTAQISPTANHSHVPQFDTPLVARTAELAVLNQVLETVVAGQGQILRIEGVAGIGKSHIAAALVESATTHGLHVAAGECQSTTEATAYAPWRQIYRALIGVFDEAHSTDDPATAQAQQLAAVETIITWTNRDWLVRLPLLGDLLGLAIADNATTAAFEPRLRQSALFDLVVEMVQTWSQAQPLLLLIDDAHWMDEASKGLTLALSRALADSPVLLVLVHRPPIGETPLLPELDALAINHRLTLEELSPEGVAALIVHRLAGQPNALALALIQVQTQGNPFFVEEVVDTLREAGNLQQRDNVWTLSDAMIAAMRRADCLEQVGGEWVLAANASLAAVDVGLPDSIQGVVLSRIDRLPETHKLTLKTASVIGRTFGMDLLEQVHPSQPNETLLIEYAAVLASRDFTRIEIPPHIAYGFKHNVTHGVAYETLLFDQRRQLHRAVGIALEQLQPNAVAQLAHHTYAGEDWPRALRYQMQAGANAQKLFANHEGVDHFTKALLCADHLLPAETVRQRQQIHANLGQLHTAIGSYDRALAHLSQALDGAAELHDHNAQAQACRWIAYVHEFRGDYPLALDWIERGLAALVNDETATTVELMALAALIYTRQGNYDAAQSQCAACVQIAERLGEATSLAFAYNSQAITFYRRGSNTNAIEYFQKAASIYEQANNIHGQAMSYNGLGNLYQRIGQWPIADTYLRQARQIFIQTGDELHQIFADNNLGELARHQGRLDDALTFYQEALHSLERQDGSRYVIGVLHMNLGATYNRRRQIATARHHLHISQDYFTRAQSRDFLPELQRHFADAALFAGEIAIAADHGQQALALARELTMRGEEGTSLRVLGKIALANGDLAAAEQHTTASIAILQEVSHEYELARSYVVLANVYLALRQAPHGLAALEQCLPVFTRLDAALDLATAHTLQAKLRAITP